LQNAAIGKLSKTCQSKTKRRYKKMSEDNNTGNNLIWAITTLIIVAIIFGALYYSGFLGGATKTKGTDVDIKIDAPAR